MTPRRSRGTAALTVALASLLVAGACGGGDSGGGSGASAGAGPGGCDATVPGSEVDYGTFAPTSSLDPTMVSGGSFGGTEMAALYDVLMVEDPETGEIEPSVAESFTANDDFTEWTLVLPAGLTFANGDPYDAENVIAHLERFSRDGTRHAARGWFGNVASMEATDARTAVFRMEEPWASFPAAFTREPGMVVNTRSLAGPEALASEAPPETGIGPYVVERYAPGEELVLRARDDYWGGPVCIERIRFTSGAGGQATYDAYRAGDLSIGHLQDPLLASIAREDGEHFQGEAQESGLVILPNHREGRATADPRVREAIMLALDEELINDRTYDGVAVTSRTLVPPESRYSSEAMAEMPSDPDRAAELVAEARADGYDGRLHAVGQNVPPFDELMLSTEGLLEAVGFEVDLELLPTQAFVTRMVEGDFDIVQSGWTGLFVMSVTTFMRSDSPANRMGYQSEAMDATLDQLLAAPDLEAQQAALAAVNDVMIDEWVAFPVAHPDAGIVVSPDIIGVSQSAATTYLFSDAYIED